MFGRRWTTVGDCQGEWGSPERLEIRVMGNHVREGREGGRKEAGNRERDGEGRLERDKPGSSSHVRKGRGGLVAEQDGQCWARTGCERL
ncbi:hypothetical protein O3P69_002560 [Scylla paramamosain]|uniref:Uncharacterized protein n=1 Tax=Scylla paramamosain TaxID=85552 RepID=A0AAW0UNR1_SCYPA